MTRETMSCSVKMPGERFVFDHQYRARALRDHQRGGIGDARLRRHRNDRVGVLEAPDRLAQHGGWQPACTLRGQRMRCLLQIKTLRNVVRSLIGMTTNHAANDPSATAGAAGDAFAVLDECHRQTLAAIAKFEAIVARLDGGAADGQTRALAADVVRHFSTTARQHHVDEERHIFPKLLATPSAVLEQAVLRMQEDHHWLEEDWRELEPQLDAIACGQVVVRRRGAARRQRDLRRAFARAHRPRGIVPLSGGARTHRRRRGARDRPGDGGAAPGDAPCPDRRPPAHPSLTGPQRGQPAR